MSEEVKMKSEETVETGEQERPLSQEEIANQKLLAISKSIKGLGMMTSTGISYCIVIPGHGVRDDFRLASCCIAPPVEKSDKMIIEELSGNVSCMIQGFLSSLRKSGLSDGAARGVLNKTIEDAKERYKEAWKVFDNAGAGPQ